MGVRDEPIGEAGRLQARLQRTPERDEPELTALQQLLAQAEELGRLTADPEVVAALRDLEARRKLGAVLKALLDGRDLPTLSGQLGAGPYAQWCQLVDGDDERLALLQRLTRELGFELDFTLKPLPSTEAAADPAPVGSATVPLWPVPGHGHDHHLLDGQTCRGDVGGVTLATDGPRPPVTRG